MGSLDTLTEHLKNVLMVLQECQIDYALAGGLAYSALVEPRATMDIDLLILLPKNAPQAFSRCLEQQLEALILHPEPMQFHLVKIWRVVSFQQDREIILDFLLAESEFHHQILNRAIQLDFLGIRLNVVTLEDLILLKKCANRPQDRADVANIYENFKDNLDHAYIESWRAKLHLTVDC